MGAEGEKITCIIFLLLAILQVTWKLLRLGKADNTQLQTAHQELSGGSTWVKTSIWEHSNKMWLYERWKRTAFIWLSTLFPHFCLFWPLSSLPVFYYFLCTLNPLNRLWWNCFGHSHKTIDSVWKVCFMCGSCNKPGQCWHLPWQFLLLPPTIESWLLPSQCF